MPSWDWISSSHRGRLISEPPVGDRPRLPVARGLTRRDCSASDQYPASWLAAETAWDKSTALSDCAGSRRAQRLVPVVTVTPFEDEADAVAIANDTPYGLSGSIWTSDVGRAIRVSRAVETGTLSVNSHSSVRYWTPFGGFKQSGLGRELGPDAPDAFTETKNVFIATD